MTIEWKTNPQGDRHWANVPKGQLIISQGFTGRWFIHIPFLPDAIRNAAAVKFCPENWPTAFWEMEDAKRALTDFYLEQTKETEQ